MSRWRAFAIHFAISAAIFVVLLAIILVFWFPGILFSIDGGWTGLRIIIGVDLVLGPLLTLVVFKAGKPGLKFDLTCIGVFQAVCLAGGMFVVHSERPVALVLAYDTVYSLGVNEFIDYGKDPAILNEFPGDYPKRLYAELPENDVSADIVNIRSQFIGDPLFIQTDRFRAMPESDLAGVFRREANTRALVSESLVSELDENCLFARFASGVTTGYVCVDAQTGRLTEFYPQDETVAVETEATGLDV